MPHAVCYNRQVRGQPRAPQVQLRRGGPSPNPNPALLRAAQVQSTAETLVARPAKSSPPDFGEYMKQRAVLVNEALERSVPLQYPEVINESMRCACVPSMRTLRVLAVPQYP